MAWWIACALAPSMHARVLSHGHSKEDWARHREEMKGNVFLGRVQKMFTVVRAERVSFDYVHDGTPYNPSQGGVAAAPQSDSSLRCRNGYYPQSSQRTYSVYQPELHIEGIKQSRLWLCSTSRSKDPSWSEGSGCRSVSCINRPLPNRTLPQTPLTVYWMHAIVKIGLRDTKIVFQGFA